MGYLKSSMNILKNIYLFLAVLGLCCPAQVFSSCSGFSCRRARAPGCAGSGLQHLGSRVWVQYLWCTGLFALRLVGARFLVQRSKLCSLHWKADS